MITITVGIESGDIRGSTNIALQAAVDYAAVLGGGTVRVLEGEYIMHDSLHLRSNITLIGAGTGKTTLKKTGCSKSFLKVTSGYGEETIKLCNPGGFAPGYGVTVSDDRAKGFLITVGTIVDMSDNETFRLNACMNVDCMVEGNAAAATIYPVISASGCRNIRIEGVEVDGNRKENEVFLDGCRGAGIYLLKTSDTIIRNCGVINFNGDGISYQNCDDVVVCNCVSKGNAGFGIHPGSGSLRTVIRDCNISGNGAAGIFFCWRVRDGLAEGCDITGNGDAGISIGHRDVNNRIINNRILRNEKGGIVFRKENIQHAAHGTWIESNEIFDNGKEPDFFGIKVAGEVGGLFIKNNKIGNHHSPGQGTGIYLEKDEKNNLIENNLFYNIKNHIEYGG